MKLARSTPGGGIVSVAAEIALGGGAVSSVVRWIAGLTVLVLVVQIGALEREIVDWDEATFMLMAQDLRQGHLPYVHALDIKPPGLFLLMAGAFAVFGETLWTARLLGDAALVLTTVFTFLIARRFASPTLAGLAAAAMAGLTLAPFAQHTSTEVVGVAFLMAALWLMLRKRGGLATAALVGVLMAAATLTRLNLVAPAVAVGGFYALQLFHPRLVSSRFAVAAYALGFGAPVALLFTIYAAAGQLDLAVIMLIEAPRRYATEQLSALEAIVLHARRWYANIKQLPLVFIPFSVALGLGAAGALARALPHLQRLRNVGGALAEAAGSDIAVLSLAFAAIAVSIFGGGDALPHYWQQATPLAAILTAWAASGAGRAWRPAAVKAALGLTAAAGVLLGLPHTARVLANPAAVADAYPIRYVAERIAEDREAGDEIWALEHHLLLWRLKLPPVSPLATHPSNLTKEVVAAPLMEAGVVPFDEYRRILARRPRYIVLGGPPDAVFYLNEEERGLLATALSESYEQWLLHQDVVVYRRR
jgi:hypothetical protein